MSTDTRTPEAGPAVRGPGRRAVDGHEFAAAAAAAGAAALVVTRKLDVDMPQVVVGDTQLALGDLASAVRAQRNVRVIGITGSNGKTTVKTLTASILARHGRTHVNAGNYNNEIGLPLTLLAMPADTEYAVLEMGAGKPGDIAYLAAIARPDIGLVNTIAPAHLERMGSLEGVAETKGALYQALPADGVAIINADDAFAGFFGGLAGSRRVAALRRWTAPPTSARDCSTATGQLALRALHGAAAMPSSTCRWAGATTWPTRWPRPAIALALDVPLATIVRAWSRRPAWPGGCAPDHAGRLDADRRQLQRQPRLGRRGHRHAGAGRWRALAGARRHGRTGRRRRARCTPGSAAGSRARVSIGCSPWGRLPLQRPRPSASAPSISRTRRAGRCAAAPSCTRASPAWSRVRARPAWSTWSRHCERTDSHGGRVMLLELADWMARHFSALHLFQYITFRTIMSALTALAVSLLIGPVLIRKLAMLKAGQVVRSDGPQTHLIKAGTPTMGGVLILLAVIVATLLWADLHNRYVWVVLAVLLAFGAIGFYDDYRKLVLKDSRGLPARWKYLLQSVFGLAAALFLYRTATFPAETALYVPLFKQVALPLGLFFVVIAYFMIVGFSNAVNLTDGLDGLAIMPTVLVVRRAGRLRLPGRQHGVLRVPGHPLDSGGGRAVDLLRCAGRRGARASCGSTPIRRRCSWATSARWPSARHWRRSR